MNIQTRFDALGLLFGELLDLVPSDRRAAAGAVAITISQQIDALLEELRAEATAAEAAAVELGRAEERLAQAEAAGQRSFEALVRAVAAAPPEEFGEPN